jgi:hypothetical protein
MSDLLKLAERWEAEAKEHSGSAWTRRCEIARHLNRCARELRAEVAKMHADSGWCPNTSLRIPKGECGCCPDPEVKP